MRNSCEYCARKHLAQATILLHESRLGYPNHVWLAIGHLAEAETEILALYPDLAICIRALRKKIERGEDPNLTEIIDEITKRKRERTGCEEPHPQHLNASGSPGETSCACMDGGKCGNGGRHGEKQAQGRSKR